MMRNYKLFVIDILDAIGELLLAKARVLPASSYLY